MIAVTSTRGMAREFKLPAIMLELLARLFHGWHLLRAGLWGGPLLGLIVGLCAQGFFPLGKHEPLYQHGDGDSRRGARV
jgi:hypothetical protein